MTDVVYNASNNELVRTKTLVKNAILVIDAALHAGLFRPSQCYEDHYADYAMELYWDGRRETS